MPTVTPTILSDGQAMDPSYRLLSLDIRKEVGRIPHAELRLLDGSAAKREFAVSDQPFFVPGATLEIKLRYGDDPDVTVFKGVVVRHGVEATRDGSLLVVGCKDAARKLAGARKSAVFRDQTDGDIFQKLIGDAGLQVGSLPTTAPQHAEMVQYQSSTWDFLLLRAEALGLLVAVDDGAISMQPLAGLLGQQPSQRFEYGMDAITEIEFEADAEGQLEAVDSQGWDIQAGGPTAGTAAQEQALSPGDLDGGALGKSLAGGPVHLVHAVPLFSDELQAWADGRLARSRLSLLRGRLSTVGMPDLKLLQVIEIAGVGKHFNGNTVITGLRHRVDADSWSTDVQFGLEAGCFAEKPGIHDPPAGGLLPAVLGLQVGVVCEFAEDPLGELRAKVKLASIEHNDSAAVWARVATPSAGAGRGMYFGLEPGDEVTVGFLNGDPRHPVILGSLFSSRNALPAAIGQPNDKNDKLGIVTKKGTTLGFLDGDKPSMYIETAAGNKLLVDDDGAQIQIADQHGNKITLSQDGIVIESASDLKIQAQGAVEITGQTVDVK